MLKAREGAVGGEAFVGLVLGPEGQKVLQRFGLIPVAVQPGWPPPPARADPRLELAGTVLRLAGALAGGALLVLLGLPLLGAPAPSRAGTADRAAG